MCIAIRLWNSATCVTAILYTLSYNLNQNQVSLFSFHFILLEQLETVSLILHDPKTIAQQEALLLSEFYKRSVLKNNPKLRK